MNADEMGIKVVYFAVSGILMKLSVKFFEPKGLSNIILSSPSPNRVSIESVCYDSATKIESRIDFEIIFAEEVTTSLVDL